MTGLTPRITRYPFTGVSHQVPMKWDIERPETWDGKDGFDGIEKGCEWLLDGD